MLKMTASHYRRETRKMFWRVLEHRWENLGPFSLFRRPGQYNGKIVYIDAGLHKQARELKLVMKWYRHLKGAIFMAFEAHPDYFEKAREGITATSLDVRMINKALVGPNDGESITLFSDGGQGLGDSVIRQSSGPSIVVPTIRLSSYLRKNGVNPNKDIVLIRMNIEGAELLVLQDLKDARMLRKIDGFFGSWDDIKKIGGETLKSYRGIAKNNNIHHLSFNNRDLRSVLRRFLINYHMTTCILIGIQKKESTN